MLDVRQFLQLNLIWTWAQKQTKIFGTNLQNGRDSDKSLIQDDWKEEFDKVEKGKTKWKKEGWTRPLNPQFNYCMHNRT